MLYPALADFRASNYSQRISKEQREAMTPCHAELLAVDARLWEEALNAGATVDLDCHLSGI